jgi:hypothetical protein
MLTSYCLGFCARTGTTLEATVTTASPPAAGSDTPVHHDFQTRPETIFEEANVTD